MVGSSLNDASVESIIIESDFAVGAFLGSTVIREASLGGNNEPGSVDYLFSSNLEQLHREL